MGSLELVLVASDGTEVRVTDEEVADWGTMKDLIEDAGTEGSVPLPSVDGATLIRLVEFTRDVERAREIFCDWDAQIDGIKAANYLAFQGGMEAIGALIAERINNADEEEMRKLVGEDNF